MPTPEHKSARVDLRMSAPNKELIERAALITGQTLTSFMVSNAVRTAQELLLEERRLRLSDRDRDLFLDALEADAAPNDALSAAARRFNERYGR